MAVASPGSRRDFLRRLVSVGVGSGILTVGARRALGQISPPRNVRIVPPVPTKTLITLNDLGWRGLCGLPTTGLANNNFSYTKGPFALRYVANEPRLLFAAYGQTPKTEQGWSAQDIFELRMPAELSNIRPLVGGAPIAECSLVPGRRWAAANWQNLGVMEPLSGIQIGAAWWDEAQQVLWYTTFGYYSPRPTPVLNAVALHDDGSCTRYGPWFYQSQTSAAWKRVCMYLAPIPAAYQSLMQARTHLMGACVMSVSDPAVNWGLGLVAVNLPPLRRAVSGRNEASFSANSDTFVIETREDLSTIPLDGSVWLWVAKPANQTYACTAHGDTAEEWWTDWPYNTQPTAIRYLGSNRWQITGKQVFRVSGTAAGSAHPGTPSAVGARLHWALTYLMNDQGVPIADFSSGTSGLRWPLHFQRREADYNNVQNNYDLCADPLWGTRIGQTGLACSAWNSASTALPDPIDGEGFWQASMDTAFTCVWVDRPTKHGLLMFGRQAFGGTWYHFYDTYANWGILDRASSDPAFHTSYGYRAERYRRVLFEYDPVHLMESAAGTRPHNATGMKFVNGGDWGARWPLIPLYREASKYPGYSMLHPSAALGGGQMAMIDEAKNELIVAMPELYSPSTGAFRPLIAVFTLPR